MHALSKTDTATLERVAPLVAIGSLDEVCAALGL